MRIAALVLALLASLPAAAQPAPAVAPAAAAGTMDLHAQGASHEKFGNMNEAIEAYIRAARSGHGPSAKRLGEIYAQGVGGIKPDAAESRKWNNAARVLGENVR
jgi:TPR repeat protein